MKIPEELNLPSIPFPNSAELAVEMLKVVCKDQSSESQSKESQIEVSILTKALIANANETWRLSTALFDQETKEIKEKLTASEIKKIAKAIEKLIATFDSLGIRIIDRLGESFNAGLPDQVVTEEQREGLTREQIIRTIRPTIIWNQTMVQRGEIDIAVPPINK